MIVLPPSLAPPAPFPLVLTVAREQEFVAPGVQRARYRLMTSAGPVVISLVLVDPHEPTVHLDAVVANDHLISRGETVSSMARRTGAVAGINADYFDIGNTNQPLNLVVRGGALERTPSRRIVLAVHRDRSVRFERSHFSGTVVDGAATFALTAINEWPPQAGASFLTPAYGTIKPAPGISILSLVPLAAAHAGERVDGTYRVGAVDDAQSFVRSSAGPNVAGPLLALGPAAQAMGPLPAVGDALTVNSALVPALDDITAAVGGGPLLVANGSAVDDPVSPAPEERLRRFPLSGAGTTPSGTLVLVSVDGRQNELSVGLTRPEFAALFLGLGATDAMAFDSGGSSEVVARVLGETQATVLGSPSDGEERAVADGLFVYSDAPTGPPVRLVVRPQSIVALRNVSVPVTLALTDAAGHALGPAHLAGGDTVRSASASRVVVVRAHGIAASVPVDVVEHPASLAITSDTADPEPGDTIHLDAHALDARGRPLFFGDRIVWTTSSGTFGAPGILRVGAHDARVVAEIGGVRAQRLVPVGNRVLPLDLFAGSGAHAWSFVSAPIAGAGTVVLADDMLALTYDFSGGARFAYANVDVPLAGEPQRISFDVVGDASGVGVRAAFVNRFGERRALTLVKSVDWSGKRTLSLNLPPDLNPPVRLVSLYVVDGLVGVATHAAGTVRFRAATLTIAGTP